MNGWQDVAVRLHMHMAFDLLCLGNLRKYKKRRSSSKGWSGALIYFCGGYLFLRRIKTQIDGNLCLASESVCQRAAIHSKILSCDIFCAITQQEFCHFA